MEQDPWTNQFMFEQLTTLVAALVVDTSIAVDEYHVDRAIKIQQMILNKMKDYET